MGDAFISALAQAWPPFVLVVGLLLIGAVVEADGLFVALGTRIERIGGGPITLLATLLGLVAVVTAVLNLDTAVVFLTRSSSMLRGSGTATSARSSTARCSWQTARRSCCRVPT